MFIYNKADTFSLNGHKIALPLLRLFHSIARTLSKSNKKAASAEAARRMMARPVIRQNCR